MPRPLPIRGLPLAPPVQGLTVMEDIVHATSSHPRRQIAPIPLSQSSSSAAVIVAAPTTARTAARTTAATAPKAAAATATAEPTTAKHPRWHPHGEYQPPQNRPRAQAALVTPPAAASPKAATTIAASATANPNATANAATANPGDFFPARRYRKSIPDFVPIRPEAFASHLHPLTIRTPLDVVRFFPFATTAAATFAGLSGLLAGGIANRALGGDTPPAWFMAGYLVLFLINFLTHCFTAKGQLFFVNRSRFLRLLAANALILLPHFIAYSILTGMAVK